VATDREIPNARRLTIALRAHEHSRHHLLATELLSRARRAHLAGATLLPARGDHLDSSLELVIVDSEAKIASFLESIRQPLGGTAATVERVEAFRA
jgi:PII-like signaling protein